MEFRKLKERISRIKFLYFIGGGSLLWLLPSLLWYTLHNSSTKESLKRHLGFVPLEPNDEDKLFLADGFISDLLVQWGDTLGNDQKVGSHCDYLTFLPLKNKDEGLLWINHEYMDPLFVHGSPKATSHKEIEQEQREVGGSVVHIKKNEKTHQWSYSKNHKLNRRLDGKTKIPLITDRAIEGSQIAVGTVGNCAGGITPWKTILTCEEGHASFYGDYMKEYPSGKRKTISNSKYGWDQYYSYPAEHYGWVVVRLY